MKYVHFRIIQEVSTEDEAKEIHAFLDEAINCLAKEFSTFVRQEPCVDSDVDFATGIRRWTASARFSISHNTLPKRYKIEPTDESMPLHGFGLKAPNALR